MGKTAVITGASGGIGLACGRRFLQEGWTVYDLSRHQGPETAFLHIPTDVSDGASVERAFARIAGEREGIDLLLNNAGFGISGPAELTDVADAEALFQVNFFGQLRCIKAALPLLRAGKGRIVNISSVAALFSIPFQSFYSAGKSATNALTLALDNELRSFGIRCVAVMPGDVQSGFTQARKKCGEEDALYGETVARSVAVMEKDEREGMSTDQVAAAVYKAATEAAPKPLRAVGGKYKFFAFLFKVLPTAAANAIVGKLYVKSRPA
ncbi:MAG: SDR family NAD(P)-dependent oxidoreductase [Bacillota bacterium]|nr:SDR family NAD(P)-dependent oxidoreductase [Bacillota bacterium]